MYFVISVVSIFLLGLAASFILPWWSICVVAFLIGIILHNKSNIPFVSGALGSILLWVTLILYYGNKDNFSFASKVSSIFSDNLQIPLSASILIIITLALIGLLGGLSSWSGKLILSGNQPNKVSVGKRRVKNEGYTLKL
jgi:hypothetical protein